MHYFFDFRILRVIYTLSIILCNFCFRFITHFCFIQFWFKCTILHFFFTFPFLFKINLFLKSLFPFLSSFCNIWCWFWYFLLFYLNFRSSWRFTQMNFSITSIIIWENRLLRLFTRRRSHDLRGISSKCKITIILLFDWTYIFYREEFFFSFKTW